MRALFRPALLGCAIAAYLLGGAWAGAPAQAGPALLIEEASGRVIYAEDPDQGWFPASLTKIMTAYVVFDAIKKGKVKLETTVPLSEKARGQPATRIGLRLGIELSVEQALRGLILRSANDFAMALAELVGESEEGFAEQMNAAAKRLGMSRSHFKNPHGLPDPDQVTTARDMAILAVAVLRDFPERAEMFSTAQFIIHRQTFHSQNDLLRTVDGADGMKTGFTCGAGYNVVATATREGRRLIAVVLGEAQRDERSIRAAALLEHGFATAEWKGVLGAPVLTRLAFDPKEPNGVHDMSKQTMTRQCGNRVRRARALVARAGAKSRAAAGNVVVHAPGAVTPAPAAGVVVHTAPAAKGPVRTVPGSSAAGGPAR